MGTDANLIRDSVAQIPTESRPTWLDKEQHELLCHIELSAMYHAKRERYLLLCERLCQAATALTATAAVSQAVTLVPAVGGGFSLAMALGIVTAVASILPLVFAWASRSNRHAAHAGDYRRLLADVVSTGYELTEPQLTAYRAKCAQLEHAEDASLGALVVQCQNEMAIARGHHESVIPLRFHHRLFMHVWDWDISPQSGGRT